MSYHIGIAGLSTRRAKARGTKASLRDPTTTILQQNGRKRWLEEKQPQNIRERGARIALAQTFAIGQKVLVPRGKGMCEGIIARINVATGAVFVTVKGHEVSFSPHVIKPIA